MSNVAGARADQQKPQNKEENSDSSVGVSKCVARSVFGVRCSVCVRVAISRVSVCVCAGVRPGA